MFKLSTEVPKEIFELAREVKKTSDKPVDLLSMHIIVDKTVSRELVMTLKDLLRPASGEVSIEVDELYEVQPHRAVPTRDVAIILCGREADRAGEIASSYSESHIPTVIITDKNSEVPPIESVHSSGSCPVSLIYIGDYSELAPKLRCWMLDQNDDLIDKFVKGFVFLRNAYFDKLIASTAKQNAIVALMPLNKADMPLMTLNTTKMASQMNWVMGRKLGFSTIGEMACIMGSGYLMRGIARVVPKSSKFARTVMDVAVSYAGTVACGKVLKNCYQLTEKLPLKVPIRR